MRRQAANFDGKKILIVFEFPPGDSEWQLRDLACALNLQAPGTQINYCYGVYKAYRPGGMSPLRILNGLFVHVHALLRILVGRHNLVIVRSTPPLIQLTVAMAARLRGIRYWIWLMDAHPEIEQVRWGRVPGISWLLAGLHTLNVYCLSRAQIVVVPDPAMQMRFEASIGHEKIIVCSTWGNGAITAMAPTSGGAASVASDTPNDATLKLAYIGNLGFAHDISLLCQFLSLCAGRRLVEIHFIGASAKSVDKFRLLLNNTRVAVILRPSVPFAMLPSIIHEAGFDYGLVTMSDEFAGLLSPSKFIGYLVGRLPIIYLGPAKTNAAIVCDEYGAGMRLDATTLCVAEDKALDAVYSRTGADIMKERITAALAHFAQYNGDYLARAMLKHISMRH